VSLVLEALRRRQAEDEPSTAVALGLATAHQRRNGTWMVLLTAALLLNAALFAWLFRDRLTEDGGAAEAAATSAIPAPASVAPANQVTVPPAGTVAPPATPGTGVTAPPAGGVLPGAPATAYAPPATAMDPALYAPPAALPQGAYPQGLPPQVPAEPRVLERIALDSLPPAARSRFPGIVISTHVYAEDPAMRAIVVNGARLQEGDLVSGLEIREINEFGVVLEFEAYLVDVPVFTDWDQSNTATGDGREPSSGR
jgi:hypothetical protein